MPIRVYRVTGDSMLPALCSGDYVVTWRKRRAYLLGSMVVVKHRAYGVIVKRIVQIVPTESGQHYLLQGDNLVASTSTSAMGLIAHSDILGGVVLHLAAPKPLVS